MKAFLSYFSITLKGNDLEIISLIEVWNHRGVCYAIDYRLKVSVCGLWEFAVPYSNVIILKTRAYF